MGLVDSSATTQRSRRRQRLQRRFAVLALPLMLAGLVVLHGFHHKQWGYAIFAVGAFVNLVGAAAAPLLHPKPLDER